MEMILEGRLKKKFVRMIIHKQFGFSVGKSTTHAIFILRHIQQKYIEKNKKLYHMFIDLENSFDRAPRSAIEWALRSQLIPEKLVRFVIVLYKDVR